jgi:mannose-6-phosphate isomerase-like protein (cupin superfamily)
MDEKMLAKLYPGKNIISIPDKEHPLEILCEVEPASAHPDWSIAVAIIHRSEPHFHKKTTETYIVEQGTLVLTVDGQNFTLKPGHEYTIKPNSVHNARGLALVQVLSKPGWTKEDHFLVKP